VQAQARRKKENKQQCSFFFISLNKQEVPAMANNKNQQELRLTTGILRFDLKL
jgi:hypothetical protein